MGVWGWGEAGGVVACLVEGFDGEGVVSGLGIVGDSDGDVGDGFAFVGDEVDGWAEESDGDGVGFWVLGWSGGEEIWEGGFDGRGDCGEVSEFFGDDWVVWPGVVFVVVVEGDGDDEGRSCGECCSGRLCGDGDWRGFVTTESSEGLGMEEGCEEGDREDLEG